LTQRKAPSGQSGVATSVPGAVRGSLRPLDEAGQGLVEYGLILVVMAVVCVASLLFFGDQMSSLLSLIASAV
jgi:Flp pilus assembly pilin Flp